MACSTPSRGCRISFNSRLRAPAVALKLTISGKYLCVPVGDDTLPSLLTTTVHYFSRRNVYFLPLDPNIIHECSRIASGPYFLRTPHGGCILLLDAPRHCTLIPSVNMVDSGRRLRAPTCPEHSHDQQNYYFKHAPTTPQLIPAAHISQDVYNAQETAKEDA